MISRKGVEKFPRTFVKCVLAIVSNKVPHEVEEGEPEATAPRSHLPGARNEPP